eukprot:851858-Heterocapsa_arctica.AAC.1
MFKDTGVWTHQLMMMSAYNNPYGSLLSPSRKDQVTESLKDFMALSSPSDPLFTHFLPFILEDVGCPERIHEAGIDRWVWDNLLTEPRLLNK